MRLLPKYTLTSLIKLAVGTIAVTSAMLLIIELFMNISVYTNKSLGILGAIKLISLRIPYSIDMVAPPSLLFSVAYTVSLMYANNEVIILLSSGISYSKIVRPILYLAGILTLVAFGFEELVVIRTEKEYERLKANTGSFHKSQTFDNTNIAIYDPENDIIITASNYNAKEELLQTVSITFLRNGRTITGRIDASRAVFNQVDECWHLFEGNKYEFDTRKDDKVIITKFDEMVNPKFSIEPKLFRKLEGSMSNMPLGDAFSYLANIKKISPDEWSKNATTLYSRIFKCLAIFVMMAISCSVNLKTQKNVLLISLATSLSLGIVYYAAGMIGSSLAKTGAVAPLWGVFMPFVLISVLAFIITRTIKT